MQGSDKLSKTRVLIVEDEAILALDIETSLKRMGYKATGVAFSAKEALALVGSDSKPHIVLMDIGLKGDMDGIDAPKKIQEQLSIPIIFITGNTDKVTRQRAMQIDPAGYLHKPLIDTEMHQTIEQALR